MPGNPARCPALAVKIYLSKRRRETSNVKLFARNQKITERWNSAMQMSGTATHRLDNTAFFLRCPKEQDWQKKSLSVTILMASGVDNARVKSPQTSCPRAASPVLSDCERLRCKPHSMSSYQGKRSDGNPTKPTCCVVFDCRFSLDFFKDRQRIVS